MTHSTLSPMKILLTLLLFTAVVSSSASAQAAADSAGIRTAALDYIEGWYTGDGARMERALHPELAKRIVRSDSLGRYRLDQQSAMTLVTNTRSGGGKDTPPPIGKKTCGYSTSIRTPPSRESTLRIGSTICSSRNGEGGGSS